jgi:hypothetical protein
VLPAIVDRTGPKRNGFFSWRPGEGGRKFLERIAKLFRVKVGDGLRELDNWLSADCTGSFF